MKVIRLPRFFKVVPGIILSGLLLAMLVLLSAPAKAAPSEVCVSPPVCVGATITLPGTTITLPRATVNATTTVTLPRATVIRTRPPVTIRVPAPVSTQTLTRTIQGPTVTVTKFSQATGKQSGPTGQTGRESGTVSPAPVATATPTVTETKVVVREKAVNVTTPQAVGLSLGLIILGAIMALVALYIANRLGYLQSEQKNVEDLRELRDSLKE